MLEEKKSYTGRVGGGKLEYRIAREIVIDKKGE
jgi:hypothetical protein